MSRTQNASRNILWGILSKIVSLVFPFITRTAMIYILGIKYVGLGSLFTSLLQVLSFAELGIGSALVFSMYKPIADGDVPKVCALLNFYRKTYQVIGTIMLLLGLAMMPFLRYLVASDLPEDINLHILFLIYLFNNVLGYFLFAYKQSIFTVTQRIDIISKIGMVIQSILSVTQILALFLFQNFYVYVAVIPVITFLNNICVGMLTDKYYPQYKCIGVIAKEELLLIEKKVGGMVFQKIGGIVLSSVDTIVISSFLGLTSLALYQNYYFIITALFGFLTIIMQSIIAGVGNSVASESVEKNYNDFKNFNFLYIWIVAWCSTCLLCLYQPFMTLWVGQENMLGNEMVVLFAIYFFVQKWCDMLYVYQEACGIWWETKFVPLIAAIVNLVINIALVIKIGLPGILVSTIASVVLIYDTGYAGVLFKTYFKQIDMGLKKYWIRQLIYFIVAITSSALTVIGCALINIASPVLALITNGVVCLFVPNIICFVAWKNLTEFAYVKGMVLKIVRKLVKK